MAVMLWVEDSDSTNAFAIEHDRGSSCWEESRVFVIFNKFVVYSLLGVNFSH